jgi:hypothetical protein
MFNRLKFLSNIHLIVISVYVTIIFSSKKITSNGGYWIQVLELQAATFEMSCLSRGSV